MSDPELVIRFEVPGQPLAKGTHRSKVMYTKKYANDVTSNYNVNGHKKGRAYVMTYPDPDTVRYESRVASIASEELIQSGRIMEYRAVLIKMLFYMQRPQNHFKTKNGEIIPVVKPAFIGVRPVTKPDDDNLEKALKDAITKIVIHDDNQSVDVVRRKVYSMFPRTEVEIWTAEDAVDPREAKHLGLQCPQEMTEQLSLT